MPLVLGVDSSTQATKVEVRDADDGRLRRDRACAASADDAAAQRAGPGCVVGRARGRGRGRPASRDIAAMSVAGQQHGLVVLDDERRRAAAREAVERHRERARGGGDGRATRRRTVGEGVRLGPGRGVHDHEARVAGAARARRRSLACATVLLPHDYLTYRLTGRFVTDRGDASGTGYWSPARRTRGRRSCSNRSLGPRPASAGSTGCPRCSGRPTPSGPLTAARREQLGLRGDDRLRSRHRRQHGRRARHGSAAGRRRDLDRHVGHRVHGQRHADRGPVRCRRRLRRRHRPLPPAGVHAQRHAGDRRLRPAARRRHRGDRTRSRCRPPPGAGGVVVLPYLSGERTPNRPDATGVVDGIRADTGREQLARAAFEGVVCGLLDGLDALEAAGAVPPSRASGRTMLVGGGARSAAYRRIVADLVGVDVLLPDGDEHVAAGACVQAAAVLHGTTPERRRGAMGTRRQDGHMAPDPGVDRAGHPRRGTPRSGSRFASSWAIALLKIRPPLTGAACCSRSASERPTRWRSARSSSNVRPAPASPRVAARPRSPAGPSTPPSLAGAAARAGARPPLRRRDHRRSGDRPRDRLRPGRRRRHRRSDDRRHHRQEAERPDDDRRQGSRRRARLHRLISYDPNPYGIWFKIGRRRHHQPRHARHADDRRAVLRHVRAARLAVPLRRRVRQLLHARRRAVQHRIGRGRVRPRSSTSWPPTSRSSSTKAGSARRSHPSTAPASPTTRSIGRPRWRRSTGCRASSTAATRPTCRPTTTPRRCRRSSTSPATPAHPCTSCTSRRRAARSRCRRRSTRSSRRATAGLDVTACLYPYNFWATYIQSARFNDGWQQRFHIDYPRPRHPRHRRAAHRGTVRRVARREGRTSSSRPTPSPSRTSSPGCSRR